MLSIIKNGQVVADSWRLVESDGEGPASAAEEGVLLPLAVWQARRGTLDPARTGVWLAPGDEPEALLADLPTIPLIAIRFPVFTDGRGYSAAHLLRGRYGYRGELRAVGDVLRDQIYFLHACGFDAFCLRADQSVDEALAALRDYSWVPLAGHRGPPAGPI